MEFTPAQTMVYLFHMVLLGSGPTLVLSAVAGLTVAVLLGAMQVNDQTLSQVVKTAVTSMTLMFFGAYLFGPLYKMTEQMFQSIALMGH